MENYTKVDTKKVYDPPLLRMDGAVEMRVANGSKLRNLLGYAFSNMEDEKVRHITWFGTGDAISKTISCVEILKRKTKDLQQITQIGVLRVEDYWEPTKEGLDTLKVSTNTPAISILLSKDPLDTRHPGYQAPGVSTVKWASSGGSSKRPSSSSQSKEHAAAVRQVKSAASRTKRPRGDNASKAGKGKKRDGGGGGGGKKATSTS